MTFHATPGTIVELDGEHFLVESARVHLLMQKIERRLPEDFGLNQHYPNHNPVYVRIEGEIGSENINRVIPLVPLETTR